MDELESPPTGARRDWAPFWDWPVLGRALGQGLLWGTIFGAIAGLPLYIIGTLPGAFVGAAAGLASAVLPGLVLATDAERWRLDLVLPARRIAGVLAAAPWLVAAVYFVSRVPAIPLALLACAVASGVTVHRQTPRILNGRAVGEPQETVICRLPTSAAGQRGQA